MQQYTQVRKMAQDNNEENYNNWDATYDNYKSNNFYHLFHFNYVYNDIHNFNNYIDYQYFNDNYDDYLWTDDNNKENYNEDATNYDNFR